MIYTLKCLRALANMSRGDLKQRSGSRGWYVLTFMVCARLFSANKPQKQVDIGILAAFSIVGLKELYPP